MTYLLCGNATHSTRRNLQRNPRSPETTARSQSGLHDSQNCLRQRELTYIKAYSEETARRTLKTISEYLEWAVLREYAEKNPYAELAVEIKTTKNKSRSRQAFSASEVAAILDAIETDCYCLNTPL
ncbi:MAG TPA: hypothetical protein V6C84_13070 [Coleofasciculaceae cyanobacterium]